MSRKPASIAPEATATADRAIATLQVLKTHLKAKPLRGRALTQLLDIVLDELRGLQEPFEEIHRRDLDEVIAKYRSLTDPVEEP